ncbi:lytic transglycosylase domain-containing protein [Photobacterium leiognathi]|uniref:lytic transglycosylase domain-containing protein n=1 Tax=Photobacterium leiognathi TaxID=553611 RepID=UPI002981ABE4|nr:lytic transglycosylase domain-containing protein [Photobacterium leiognathi]
MVISIPAIESGFNPKAKSSAGAVGLWQLMPETARDMGLIVNGDVDERYDWQKSTVAAVKYLKWLADTKFNGDYELAILAYNGGVGRVLTAIKKEQSTNAWDLSAGTVLPKETREYLPKVVTYIHLFNYYDTEG